MHSYLIIDHTSIAHKIIAHIFFFQKEETLNNVGSLTVKKIPNALIIK